MKTLAVRDVQDGAVVKPPEGLPRFSGEVDEFFWPRRDTRIEIWRDAMTMHTIIHGSKFGMNEVQHSRRVIDDKALQLDAKYMIMLNIESILQDLDAVREADQSRR